MLSQNYDLYRMCLGTGLSTNAHMPIGMKSKLAKLVQSWYMYQLYLQE